MRIGIVNDLKLACEALRRVLSSTGHQVVWTAYDGAEAVTLAVQDPPDLILMDLIMPRVDGVEATRRIMAQAPCAILVVTSSVTGNISKVYEAMSHGAQDAVDTPVLGAGGKLEGAAALLQKIGLFEKLLNKPATPRVSLTPRIERPSAPPPTPRSAPRDSTLPPLVVIGVSTGGPRTLTTVLAGLPASFSGCVVIVQHIDRDFATGLAEWLAPASRLPVKIAADGQEPARGQVLLARTGDHHLVVTPGRRLAYSSEPRDQIFRPSVDVFFASVARNWPEPGIAVILTGMERDGAQGLLTLKLAGWHTIAQDPATCVVQSMPKAAIELAAARQVLPPHEIASAILARTQKRPTTA